MNILAKVEQQFYDIFGNGSDLFQQGKKDCFNGLPAQSDDEEYQECYAAQYQLEQIAGGLSDD